MADCKNAFYAAETFTITGRGDNEADAKKDLEEQRDKKLKELSQKLDCKQDKCPLGELGEDKSPKECQFDWGPTLDEPKPHTYTVTLHRSKMKKERVSITQTFEVGCFCF